MFDSILKNLEQFTYTQESLKKPIQPVILVILDINMPVMDGLQAANLLKEKFEDFNKKIIEANKLTLPYSGYRPFVRPLLIHLT